MVAALCGLRELIRADPAPYRNLVHYFTNILKQVGGDGWVGWVHAGLGVCLFVCRQRRGLRSTHSRHLSSPTPTHAPQAAEGKLGRSYEYHRAPAPFVQLELLRLLALLGAGDRAASENMYAVLADVKRLAEPLGNNIGEWLCCAVGRRLRAGWCGSRNLPPAGPGPLPSLHLCRCHPAGNALVYECIKTLTAIHPSPALVAGAVESVSRFLAARDNNLRYAGIDALTRLVRLDPKHAADHQLAVVDCPAVARRHPQAQDAAAAVQDGGARQHRGALGGVLVGGGSRAQQAAALEQARPASLPLLADPTPTPPPPQVVAGEVLGFLRDAAPGDEVARGDAVRALCDLAERYAPDHQWFVDTMNALFEVAGAWARLWGGGLCLRRRGGPHGAGGMWRTAAAPSQLPPACR